MILFSGVINDIEEVNATSMRFEQENDMDVVDRVALAWKEI